MDFCQKMFNDTHNKLYRIVMFKSQIVLTRQMLFYSKIKKKIEMSYPYYIRVRKIEYG